MVLDRAISQEPELLDIAQAAALLHVSPMSLRRWTNSGRLPCFRVGGGREGRFRRRDLLALLERTDDPTRDAPVLGHLGGLYPRVAARQLRGLQEFHAGGEGPAPRVSRRGA